MNDRELLIQQICELDETANPRFLGLQSTKDLQEFYDCLVEMEEIEAVVSCAD